MAMREHLFRGKGVVDKEWVYGIPLGDAILHIRGKLIMEIEIDPETVCEFTGLTDKNGTMIFEGDIVKAFKYNETPMVFPITFRSGCYWYGNWNFIEFLDKFRNIEVIGNIFDNPELVGGDKNGNS